jgi:WD40 repeat protein
MSKNLLRAILVIIVWCLVVPAANTQPLPKARIDPFGDPLPDGAVARLSTTRWRLYHSPLTFAPNGQYAIVTSARIPFLDAPKPYGETTRLLDAATGTSMQMFPQPSWGAFFTGDNKVVILEHRNVVRFLNVETGKIIREIKINGPCAWITGTTWSADGKRMACQYHNNLGFPLGCYVWDLEQGVELYGWEKEGGNCALSSDGTLLAIRANQTIGVFSVDEKNVVCKWDSEDPISTRRAVVFLPDGKTLITSEKNRVLFWDPPTGKLKAKSKLGPVLETKSDDPVAFAISADGRYFAAGGSKGTVSIWDLQAEALLHTLPDAGKRLPITHLNFTPDGKRLVSQAAVFPSARVWDVASGKELTPRNVAASNFVGMMFTVGGKALATTAQLDPIQLWDAASGKLLRDFEHPEKTFLCYTRQCPFVLTSSGKALVAAQSGEALMWNLADGKLRHRVKTELPKFDPGDHKHFTWTTCCPDEDTIIAVYSGDVRAIVPPRGRMGPIKVYWTMIGIADANTGKIQRSFRVDPESLDRLCLSPDGSMLAAVGGSLRVWDLQGEGEIFKWDDLPKQHGWESLAFSADSRKLFVTSQSSSLDKRQHAFWVLDIASGKTGGSSIFKFDPTIHSVGAIANENLAAISKGETITLFDPLTGKEYGQVKTNLDKIGCLAFSSDGKRLASAGDDTTVLIWDITDLVPAAARETQKKSNVIKPVGIAVIVVTACFICVYICRRFLSRRRHKRELNPKQPVTKDSASSPIIHRT